jgi:hypothetical protein
MPDHFLVQQLFSGLSIGLVYALMATMGGARVLGLEQVTGTLEAGKRADWIQLAKGVGSDPLYWLFDTHLPVLRTVSGGRELYSAFAEAEAAAEDEARRRALERGDSAWPEQDDAPDDEIVGDDDLVDDEPIDNELSSYDGSDEDMPSQELPKP